MAKCALLYFSILISVGIAKAQTSDMAKGQVIDCTSRLSVSNATVEVYKDKKVIQTVTTDSSGRFSISLDSYIKPTSIRISRLNYHSLNVYLESLNNNKKHNQNDLGTFKLSPKITELREVVINRSKRYQDTTVIDLSKEKFERTFMVSNILTSNNGFYIDGAGQLFYKGKQVTDITADGGTFFGKNNLSVYENLPALILKNIQIVETNINSLTNITMIRPSVKVNLNIKEDYKKGEFGSGNLGIGTLKRYIASANLYKYKRNEQVSFAINSNNININASQLSEPSVMFSANGNNTVKIIPKIEYRNIYLKKLEVVTSLNAVIENRTITSESERKEKILNQQTKVYNSSKVKSLNIDQSSANLTYRMNPQNTIKANFNVDYAKADELDSLYYNIMFDTRQQISSLYKKRTNTKKNYLL